MSTVQNNWAGLVNESVHTSDDKDIGDIEAVSRDFVVVKRGFRKIHRYYIPISKVEGWDGNVLWLTITEDQVKRNYERDMVPHPSRYFIKDMGDNQMYYSSARLPELRILQTRYAPPVYPSAGTEASRIYRCDLCETTYRDEDDLSTHVRQEHGEIPVESETRSPVLDWDAIIHKNVRSSDMNAVGNVGAVTDETIVIMRGPAREFIVPKSHVEGFDGAEVRLDISYRELEASYKRVVD